MNENIYFDTFNIHIKLKLKEELLGELKIHWNHQVFDKKCIWLESFYIYKRSNPGLGKTMLCYAISIGLRHNFIKIEDSVRAYTVINDDLFNKVIISCSIRKITN